MDWTEDWFRKALIHKEAAQLLKKHNYLKDAISRFYYSAFSIMIAVCGPAPKGRWEHKGILKHFFKWCKENSIELSKENRELLSTFYDIRRMADYTTEDILIEEVNAYENLVNQLFEVIDDWRENNS